MAIIQRPDGAQFTCHNYREHLEKKSASLFKTEIRLLAQTNGQYVRLIRQSGSHYEAVFSRDTGYLLGESIWHALGRPRHLIFCEVQDDDVIVVVIVKNGVIHLDAVLSFRELLDELISACADPYAYVVKIFGDLPISELADPLAKFVFPQNSVRSFDYLETPLFANLKLYDEYRLLPLEQAIQTAKIGKTSPWLAAVAMSLLAVMAWWFWPVDPSNDLPQQLSAYQQFQASLQAPEIKLQIQDVQNALTLGFSVPGWQATHLEYAPGTAQMELHSFGGSTRGLLDWAQQHHFDLDLTSRGAMLTLHRQLSLRQSPEAITPSINTLATIIDRMLEIFPSQKTVSVGDVRDFPLYRITKVTITLSQASEAEMGIVREQLAGLPIKLQDAHINVNNGLFSGTINLIVIGS